MRTTVDHTDQGEEECRHQTVREHLEDSTGHCSLIEHQDCEEHQTAVAYRRVSVDIFEVCLHACRESTVNDADTGQDEEDPSQLVSGLGHQEDRHAEATVSTQFHQHAGVQH